MKSKLILLLITSLLFMEHGLTQPSDSVLTVLRQRYDKVLDYSEGLTMVGKHSTFGSGKGYDYGFVDDAGNVVIPLKYAEAANFKDGLSMVEYVDRDNGYTHNYGFIDKTGKEVIPLRYETAYPFAEGLAAVQLGEKWGFVDKTGKIIIPFEYNEAKPFVDGLARVNKKDHKYGYIDKNGEVVIPFEYYNANPFSEGLASVMKKKPYKWGFIDKSGKEVIPFIYSAAYNFKDGLALVGNHIYGTENWEYGYINKNGEVVIPLKYRDAKSFTGDFAYVNRYGTSWSAINRKGETLPHALYLGVVMFYSNVNSNDRINIEIYPHRDDDSHLPFVYRIFEPYYYSKMSISKAIVEKYSENPCEALLMNSEEIDYSKMDSLGVYPLLLPPGKYKLKASKGDRKWENTFEVKKGVCYPILLK